MQREAFARSSLYNLIHTEALNTHVPKRLRRQVFTHRGIYTKVLHTHAANASNYTQKLLNTGAFPHRSIYPEMLWHIHAYTQKLLDSRHRWFFREPQKLWHREAFTQTIFYTQKLSHTQAFPQKLLHREAFEHRSFCTQRSLHTEACTHGGFTHRSFYTEKPLHLYTQTLSHRKTDSTEELLHTSKNRNFT